MKREAAHRARGMEQAHWTERLSLPEALDRERPGRRARFGQYVTAPGRTRLPRLRGEPGMREAHAARGAPERHNSTVPSALALPSNSCCMGT